MALAALLFAVNAAMVVADHIPYAAFGAALVGMEKRFPGVRATIADTDVNGCFLRRGRVISIRDEAHG